MPKFFSHQLESWIWVNWVGSKKLLAINDKTFHHGLFQRSICSVRIKTRARNQTTFIPQGLVFHTGWLFRATEDMCLLRNSDSKNEVTCALFLSVIIRDHGTQLQLALTWLKNFSVWHSTLLWTVHFFCLSGSSMKLLVPVILFRVLIAKAPGPYAVKGASVWM